MLILTFGKSPWHGYYQYCEKYISIKHTKFRNDWLMNLFAKKKTFKEIEARDIILF
jgi:hypothetical protein